MDTHGYITDFSCYNHYCMWHNPHWLRYIAASEHKLTDVNPNFTYCEIGCGHGQTVAINAAANPQSQFYGLDINKVHYESMIQYRDELGITNFHPMLADILQPQELPKMDFIVAHGVLSWVSSEVVDGVYDFISKHLKPGGLVVLSFDSLPGCSHREQIANIVQRHIREADTTEEGLRASLQHFAWLLNNNSNMFEIMPMLDSELKKLGSLQNIAHQYGNACYQGFYFDEVNRKANNAGVEYVGNIQTHRNIPNLCFKTDVVKSLPSDIVKREIVMQELLSFPFAASLFRKPSDEEAVDITNMTFVNALPREHMKSGKSTPLGRVAVDEKISSALFDRFETPTTTRGVRETNLLIALSEYVLPASPKTQLSCYTKRFIRNLLLQTDSESVPFPSSVLGSGVGVPCEVACVIVSEDMDDAQKFAGECNKPWSTNVNDDLLPQVTLFRDHLKALGAWNS